MLRGRPAGAAALGDARAAVAETVVRADDGSARHLAGTLAARALAGALRRTGAEVR